MRQRALSAIIANATQVDDFDVETFHASESAPEQWVAAASTTPFLSERRTVIVRMLAKADFEATQIAAAAADMKNLPETARLVLVGDEDAGDEQSASVKEWARALKEWAWIEDCSVDKDKVAEIVRRELASHGKKMLPTAINLLIEMCGGSLTASLEELDKLALYVGESETISEKDVAAVVVPSREWRIYSIIHAVLARNMREALILLRHILGSARKLEDAAFGKVFPPFSSQLRLVWQARVVLDMGGGKGPLPPEIRAVLPASGSIAEEKGWRADQAFRLAKSTTLAHLSKCFEALARADARIKGIREDGISTEETLERMIAEMCGEAA